MPDPAGQASGLLPPMARDNGSQKALKPYPIFDTPDTSFRNDSGNSL
jgi:hypothetical protein